MTPSKIKLQPNTRKRIRARRKWRALLIERAFQYATWPVGKPGREAFGASVRKAIARCGDLYGRRSARVVSWIT